MSIVPEYEYSFLVLEYHITYEKRLKRKQALWRAAELRYASFGEARSCTALRANSYSSLWYG